MSQLLLDALFPPAPDQLVADCRAVGAAGCWVYVLRRAADGTPLDNGSWTPAHVRALRAAGLRAPAIVVPGNVPPPAADAVAALQAFGCDLVMGADFELASEPPVSWEDELEQACAAAGIRELNYGPASELGRYDPGEPGWLASWLRTGQLEPIPAVPAGQLAWQFVNDVRLPSGALYDASVVDESVFGGVNVAQLDDIQSNVDKIYWLLEAGDEAAGNLPDPHYSYLKGVPAALSQVLAEVQQLQQPVADPTALAAALVANPDFVNAIAKAVVGLEAAKLSAP